MRRLLLALCVWSFAVGAGAAPTLVQSKHTGILNTNVGAESTGGNTFKLTLPNKSLANNCLILGLNYAFSAGRTVTITDDKSNSWPGSPTVTTNNGTMSTSLFVLPNATAGVQVITITFDAKVGGFQAVASEWYNIATSSPVDTSAVNNAAAAPTVSTASMTTGTSGDLIYNYAVDVQNGTSGGTNANVTAITNGTNFTLQSADFNLGIASQSQVQSAAGAITSTVTVTMGAGTDAFNTVAVALKPAVSGTAPSGIRIVHEFTVRQDSAGLTSPFTFQFPTSGNLIVGMLDIDKTNGSWTATSSSPSNTWVQVSTATAASQAWYSATPSVSATMTITITWTIVSSTPEWHFYDIAGAANSPYDTEADTTGSVGGAANTGNAPAITPTNTNGLILGAMAIGLGPADTFVTSNGFYDNTTYTGESDAGQINNGDSWSHVFNSSASTVDFVYHMTQATSWEATAVAFKAAPVSSSTPRMTLVSVGP